MQFSNPTNLHTGLNHFVSRLDLIAVIPSLSVTAITTCPPLLSLFRSPPNPLDPARCQARTHSPSAAIVVFFSLSLSRSLFLRVTYLPANLLPVEGGTLALQPAGRAIITRKPRTRRAPFTLDRRSRGFIREPRRYELSQPSRNPFSHSFARARRNVKRAMAYLKFHGCVPRATVESLREPSIGLRAGRRSPTIREKKLQKLKILLKKIFFNIKEYICKNLKVYRKENDDFFYI